MEITLMELLNAREERAHTQKELQKKFNYPLICFTMNIAGPVKTSPLIIRAFNHGLDLIEKSDLSNNIANRKVDYNKCGPVAYYSLNADAKKIKELCVYIEDSCKLGRLFDMDVIDTDGQKLERNNERGCIICKSPGRYCASSRKHSVNELQHKTEKIITDHFRSIDQAAIALLAKNSLIDEVLTTPKPGLVDSNNNGSHHDMNVESFKKSAAALYPYFEQCLKIGFEGTEASPDSTFHKLRLAGLEAEKEMYFATNGVNTHKGIIYSMGVLLCAIGKTWSPVNPFSDIDKVFKECSRLVEKSVKNDLEAIDKSTAGGRLYLSTGEKGIRGEVSQGFPSVKNISLPVFCKAFEEGKNKNDAGIVALLHLMGSIYDTSVYNRGGEEGVYYAQKYANKILSQKTFDHVDILKMDLDFIKKNLSPGGAADLLAITYFINDLKNYTTNSSNE